MRSNTKLRHAHIDSKRRRKPNERTAQRCRMARGAKRHTFRMGNLHANEGRSQKIRTGAKGTNCYKHAHTHVYKFASNARCDARNGAWNSQTIMQGSTHTCTQRAGQSQSSVSKDAFVACTQK
eukprot:GDKI01034602.1.p1 GENE.GDKI01034602.1~~GDKI01034602.1.p1  ORF type:complete len:123 (-),score=5.95 GDKI01034602.1:170-538(-)